MVGRRIRNGWEMVVDLKTYVQVMSAPFECDGCGKNVEASARYVVRVPRPSDPSDWCGTMWTGPCCAENLGAKSEAYWDKWIESDEARSVGAMFLT